MKNILNESIGNIFTPNKKCIINADIDGIIAGILLQNFLNWEVVGYSSCCGKPDDELWLYDDNENLNDCIFVDLPVSIKNFSVIDQHFISINEEEVERYQSEGNKINPNVLRKRNFVNKDYTAKYPFGTAHFVLAVLENLGYIPEGYIIDFFKKINDFDLADLVLRADRVIGNTNSYTPNCIDWAHWIESIGGVNTEVLFDVVIKEHQTRSVTEKNVEKTLLSFGCKGIDGDCSNLFRCKDYQRLFNYFSFLGSCLDMPPLPVFVVHEFGMLTGYRVYIDYNTDFELLQADCNKDNVFSYAFVTMKALSMTLIDKK